MKSIKWPTILVALALSLNVFSQVTMLKILPNPLNTLPGRATSLSATGGTAPYRFTTNIGSISMFSLPATFTPAASGNGIITVIDSKGVTATTPVTVYSALKLASAAVSLNGGQTYTIVPTGGKTPYRFTKNSGLGSINGAVFTAPLVSDVSTISVVDDLGQLLQLKFTTTPVTPPAISFMGTNKLTFTAGEPVTLSWGTTNATSLKLDPGAINVTGKTSYVVYPSAATDYILTATNSAKSVTAKKTILPNKVFDGSGIALNIASSCVLNTINDYMELMTYNNRRIEPADCSVVKVATPVFSWVLPMDKLPTAPMTLVMTRLSDGYAYSISSTSTRLLLPFALTQGMYEWVVKYTNKSNALVRSAPRKFLISASNQFVIPTGVNLANRVALKPHPRAVPSGSTIDNVVSAAGNGEYKYSFEKYLRYGLTAFNTAIPSVPKDVKSTDYPPNSTEYAAILTALKNKSIDEAFVIESLGYVAKFSKNESYKTAGINHLMALAAWPSDPWSATSETVQDQANREIFLSLAQGLDLFHESLTAPQRQLIVASLKKRLKQTMDKFSGFDRNPYDSHLLTCVQYATQALMYAVGTPEFPEANALLASSWESLVTNSGVWGGGSDGAYGNGTSYGWYATGSSVNLIAAARLIADVDLTKWPVYGNIGFNQMAFYPAAANMRGQFGDELENVDQYFTYSKDSIRLLAKLANKPEYEWYWRAYPDNVTYTGFMKPFHYLLAGLPSNIPTKTPVLSSNMLFEDAGVVAFHTNTTDSLRSSLFFRSSRLGSFNHSHADNNAFTFVSKGKELFISGGYYPSYGTNHHKFVTRATRFKNALTFDGGIGQGEPVFAPTAPGAPVDNMDARGKLINFNVTTNWSVTTGDATLAYRGRDPNTGNWNPLLTSAIRSIAYDKADGVILIYDFATSTSNRFWELNFQSLNLPELSNLNKTVKISNAGSSACMDVYGLAGSFKTSSGFPIAPEVARPDQFHSIFRANVATSQLASVTVIRENCSTVPVNVSVFGTKASINVNGKYIVLDKKTIQSN
jgi:hypothetical protein